jgi:hypothetical protein
MLGGEDSKGLARRPTGGIGATDGADRAKPRPGGPKQDVEGRRANPPLPNRAAFRKESRFCFL